MIERTPDIDVARAAAAAIVVDVEQAPSAAAPATPPASSSSSTPGAQPSAVLTMERDKLVAMGALLIYGATEKAAQRWGAHWLYNEVECMAVSGAALDVAELYMGDVSSPWTRLGLVLAGTALPRLLGPKQAPLAVPSTAAAEPASAVEPASTPEPAEEVAIAA